MRLSSARAASTRSRPFSTVSPSPPSLRTVPNKCMMVSLDGPRIVSIPLAGFAEKSGSAVLICPNGLQSSVTWFTDRNFFEPLALRSIIVGRERPQRLRALALRELTRGANQKPVIPWALPNRHSGKIPFGSFGSCRKHRVKKSLIPGLDPGNGSRLGSNPPN